MAASLKLHLVTLGVADVERAAAFYRALGMDRRLKSLKEVAFFDAGGVVFSVWDRKSLAKEAGLEDSKPGFGGFALAFNVESEAAVEAMLEAAAKAGGKILKPAQRAFWGGYHGHFADPDGHPWEVAHNPQFPFDERGQIVLPE